MPLPDGTSRPLFDPARIESLGGGRRPGQGELPVRFRGLLYGGASSRLVEALRGGDLGKSLRYRFAQESSTSGGDRRLGRVHYREWVDFKRL